MGGWVDRREQKEKEKEGIHCIICDKLCKNAYGLANHVTKTHRMSFLEYKRRVVERAEEEYILLKAIAIDSAPNLKENRGIQHLFELLKEGWK